MRFELTDEQRDFADSLEALLAAADTASVSRAWADGDHAPGLKLWARLAEQGVSALLVPEEYDGLGASPVELAIAFEALGRHCVPGPWIESAAYLARTLAGDDLAAIAAGTVATVAAPPDTPYALDADVAELVFFHAESGELWPADPAEQLASLDPTRHLFRLEPSGGPLDQLANQRPHGLDAAVLACSAELLGAGERLLADTVAYVKQRRQFGREIGSYQAVKHQLADVRIALDFARPLVLGAALTLDSEHGQRDVSAAKVAAGDAAYLASRAALQLHGAVGYTRELDLSLWITRVRALVSAWGTPRRHRARVLGSLLIEGD